MNKLEYIPGDLVMTNGVPLGTAKDVVYRVTLRILFLLILCQQFWRRMDGRFHQNVTGFT